MLDDLSMKEQKRLLERAAKVPAIEAKLNTILVLTAGQFMGVIALLITILNFILS